jgi:dipeptidyl aminopeptidase/acylaminoacyl peptidase
MPTRQFFCLLFLVFLSSCASPAPADSSLTPLLIYIQSDPSGTTRLFAISPLPLGEGAGPALSEGEVVRSTPQPLSFSLPVDCSLYNLYPSPTDYLLAAEFYCVGGPAVQLLDLYTAQVTVPAEAYQVDSRFLAWSADGRYLYLKADSLGTSFILRVDVTNGRGKILDLPETVYDMAALPDGRILYALSRGLGFGSEVWSAKSDGRNASLLFSEPADIVAYLRPSPDGSQVAYILLPDSSTPFPEGELWLRGISGENARFLAAADAGHGYAPAWSPDGTQIAFVTRLTSEPFTSRLSLYDFADASLTPLTQFEGAVAGTPVWSPDGTSLVFDLSRDGTIQVWIEDFSTGVLLPLDESAASCCAVWLPGK